MTRSLSFIATCGFVLIAWFAAAGQQGATAGAKPGSAVKGVKASTVAASSESASLTIACQSAVDLMITDPKGRRLGDDPVAHAHHDEIPSAYYEAGGIDDDETGEPEEDPAKTIFIPDPAAGSYQLTVVGAKSGKYSCQFTGVDRAGKVSQREYKDVEIGSGQVQTFTVRFSGTPGSGIEVVKK